MNGLSKKSLILIFILVIISIPGFTQFQDTIITYKHGIAETYSAFDLNKSGTSLAVAINPYPQVFLYDILTGKEIARLSGLPMTPVEVYFDNVNSHIIALSQNNVAIWNGKNYQLIQEFTIPAGLSYAYAENPGHLAIALPDKIIIYDIKKGSEIASLSLSQKNYTTKKLVYSPDDRFLYCVTVGNTYVEELTTSDYSLYKTIEVPDKVDIKNIACSANTLVILCHNEFPREGTSQVVLQFYDREGNKKKPDYIPTRAFQTWNAAIKMMNDSTVLLQSFNGIDMIPIDGGDFLLSFVPDFTDFLFQENLGFVLFHKEHIVITDYEGQLIIQFEINGTGSTLFSVNSGLKKYIIGKDNRISINPVKKDIDRNEIVYRTSLEAMVNTYDAGGNYVVFPNTNYELEIWDLKKEKVVNRIPHLPSFPVHVAIDDIDKRVLASFAGDSYIYIWDLLKGTLIKKIDNNGITISSLAINNKQLAVGDVDGNATVWSLHDYKVLHYKEKVIGNEITSIHVSKDGNILALGSLGRAVCTFLDNSTKDLVFQGHNSYIRGIQITDNNSYLITSAPDSPIKLWDIKNCMLIENFNLDSGWMNKIFFKDTISFFGTGPSLEYVWFDNSKLYNTINNPKPSLVVQSSNSSSVSKIIFNEKGNLMAAIDNDTVKIWDIKTGFIVSKISTKNKIINDIRFANSDKTLIIAAGDYIVYTDPYTGKEIKEMNLRTHSRSIHQCELFPERPLLCAINKHGWHPPLFFHLNSGKYLGSYQFPGDSPSSEDIIFDLKISHNGEKAAIYGKNFIRIHTLFDKNKHPEHIMIPREKPGVHNQYWTDYIDFSEDDNYICYVSFADDYYSVVYDLIQKKEIVRQKGKLAQFGKGHTLLFMNSNETLALLDADKNESMKELRGSSHQSLISSIAYNSKENIFATGDIWGNIKLWDADSGSLLKEINRFTSDIYHSEMSSQGEFIAYNSKQGLFLIDLKKMKIIETGGNNYPYFGAFSPDNSVFYYRKDKNYYYIDLKTLKNSLLFETGINSKDASGTLISRDNKYLLFNYKTNNELMIYNLAGKEKQAVINTHRISDYESFSISGFHPVNSGKVTGYGIKKKNDAMLTIEFISYDYMNSTIDEHFRKFEIKAEKDSAFFHYTLKGSSMDTLSPTGKYYAFLNDYHVIIKDMERDIQVFDKFTLEADHIEFSSDEKYLIVGDNAGYITKISLDTFTIEKTFKAFDNSMSLLTIKGRFLHVLGNNELIKIFDLNNNDNELFSLGLMGDGDFIFTHKDNYYFASKNARNGVAFKKGTDIFPFEQFDLKFNRPDKTLKPLADLGIVSRELITSYYALYQKRLKKLNFTDTMLSEDLHLPEVSILNKNLPYTTHDKNFSLSIKAVDSKYLLDRIHVYINDVPVYGIQGINLRKLHTAVHEQKITLGLSHGKNKIQVTVLNEKGVESLKTTFEIYYTGTNVKPDLYVVAIGVSEYKDSSYNLTYAAKDAENLTQIFQNQTEDFNQVHIQKILNQKATRGNIVKIKDFLMKTKVDDTVILFIAGHGLLDENLDYFFCTTDMDFYNPAKRGLPYEAIEDLIDSIPARKKLLLMDTCHSGEIDNDELTQSYNINNKNNVISRTFPQPKLRKKVKMGAGNSSQLLREFFADLRRGSGAMIISAASGLEFAFESDSWKNGVFTYSVLEGLNSGNADINSDGDIYVSELREYVIKKVQELTNNLQTPTSRRENLEFDFKVY